MRKREVRKRERGEEGKSEERGREQGRGEGGEEEGEEVPEKLYYIGLCTTLTFKNIVHNIRHQTSYYMKVAKLIQDGILNYP